MTTYDPLTRYRQECARYDALMELDALMGRHWETISDGGCFDKAMDTFSTEVMEQRRLAKGSLELAAAHLRLDA